MPINSLRYYIELESISNSIMFLRSTSFVLASYLRWFYAIKFLSIFPNLSISINRLRFFIELESTLNNIVFLFFALEFYTYCILSWLIISSFVQSDIYIYIYLRKCIINCKSEKLLNKSRHLYTHIDMNVQNSFNSTQHICIIHYWWYK